MSSTVPVGVPAPTPPEADSGWADLPHELLVQIFAAQPEPLHNLSGEFVCRTWAYAVHTDWSADHNYEAYALGSYCKHAASCKYLLKSVHGML